MTGVILVTGATGRVGRRVVEALLKRKANRVRIRVLVENREAALRMFGSRVEIVEHDLAQDDLVGLGEACSGVDAVIHLAGLVDYSASERQMMRINFEATARLIRACELKGVRRFVFISSTSIYRGLHLPSGSIVSEKTTPHPSNAYGRSKLASEKALEESRLDYVILRPPIVYGEGFEEGFGMVARMLKKGRFALLGSGENAIAFIHVDDLVRAVLCALSLRASRRAFIVTSGETLTQRELVGGFAQSLGVAAPVRHVSPRLALLLLGLQGLAKRLAGKRPSYYKEYLHTLCADRRYDISMAKKTLNFRPSVKFKTEIRRFARQLNA